MTTEITVESIIAAGRPSLAERAKKAFEERSEDERRALEDKRNDLIADICDWLNNELGVDFGTRQSIKFIAAGTEKALPVVTFRCEGVTFRGRYDTRRVRIDTSGLHDINEEFLAMQVSKSPSPAGQHAWNKVETLADIGKAI